MKPQALEISSPLAERFQELHDAVYSFATEAMELHRSTAVTDDAGRALFTALSKMTAYSDQLQMILTLMDEDMRVVEEIGLGPNPEFESPELENCFYDWLRTSRKGGVAVN